VSDEFDIVDNLILNGGLEFAGKDSETGEPLYKPTDRLKDIDNKLSEEMSIYFSEVVLKLWEKGFLDMDVTQRDPVVKLGSKSFDVASIKSLPKDERVVVEQIVKVLFNKN
jgi:hypothetical protein